MTYIEFFNNVDCENIISCLTAVPDRVIMFGSSNKLIEARKLKYEKVFCDRGHNIEFIARSAAKNRLDLIIEKLTEIVNTYDDCVFDITGGDELLILALGMVYSANKDKNIQIHKINIDKNTIYDCDMDGKTVYRETPVLSAEENVRIYGGEIIYGDVESDHTYRWDLNSDFLADVEYMWRMCRTDVRYWNMQMGVLDAANEKGVKSNGGLTLTISMSALENELKHRKAKYKKAPGIINYLMNKGLITEFDDESDDSLKVTFKNHQVKRCLVKAGMVLEMKVYTTVKRLTDKKGTPIYNDALNGVVIDWDGVCHDERKEHIYDTENEVDVIVMHDAVPVFISCKNGDFDSDELYKLNTVARRFGGQYGKRVLVATTLEHMNNDKACYIRQRAKDMNITLIDDIHQIDDKEIEARLNGLWSE